MTTERTAGVSWRRIAAVHPGAMAPGSAVVAGELRLLDGRVVACPSGVLFAGELRARGLSVEVAPMTAALGQGSGNAVAILLSEVDGDPAGLGFAVPDGDVGARQAAHEALADWSAAVGARTVLLASPRAFCAGVERAIDAVDLTLERVGGPVHVRKQIVHNVHVVKDLEAKGAVFVDELAAVPEGATVVFSAHGVSPAVRGEAERRGLEVIDATCPLVAKVHIEARRFAGRGDTVILVGHAGHEETEGTLGEAPGRILLVESPADVAALDVPDPSRVSYLTQTTLAVDEAAEIVAALRERFPELRGPSTDDICYATTNRQEALRAVAAESDLVLVVGSANSSNSLRLVEVAERQGTSARLVDDAGGLRSAWLAGVARIGLTAGASAPPRLVEEVIEALSGFGPVDVEVRETTRETVQFGPPPGVSKP
ncbi:4-hydroxy-3-methylbut-2-enyl diphosphate reductase [Phytomonospora sp. NPDC050363]|uniref:4-hydroxy-3-methylbut-2-enyl diphosphate reductase n=1 Tax=Phytomonospora sp. NPDC050363 TaxID=3155642 RepID=UPI0033D9CD03